MVNVKEIEGKNFNIKRSAEEDRILSFKDHVCIGCGLCEATCPVEAIALDEVAPIERKYTETYFSGHEKIAQNYALFKNDNEIKAKLCIAEDKCVLCGMCRKKMKLIQVSSLQLKLMKTNVYSVKNVKQHVQELPLLLTEPYLTELT